MDDEVVNQLKKDIEYLKYQIWEIGEHEEFEIIQNNERLKNEGRDR